MSRFHVLIHASFYTALRALSSETRARFRRVVHRLHEGQWGGGTRVRKLRGCTKPVFEARQDDGDRILFTLAHTASRDGSGRLQAHLQLWDLVHHDRVSIRAARINPSAEAEFLDFEQVEGETIGEPPPHPAASFDEIPGIEPDAEAGVVELMLAPDSARPRAREEIIGGVRWYVVPDQLVADERHWQELMDRGPEELELKLTAEQYAVVQAPGPVLLSGSAGSGKTTIAVHRLAAAACHPGAPRTLYVTYSRWLLDHARRLFADLLACRGDTPPAPPELLTVHDLYRSLIAARGGVVPDRVVGYPEFARWYRATFRREDVALAWEEIRSIVKGASIDAARPLLSREDYEALGRKRAPLFAAERGRLHDVARRWQAHLEAARLADEIDFCRGALTAVPAGGRYDHVICDEAQDLAEIQVELLLRLLRGPALEGLFLAGDPQQVINPSGFRWAEARSRIRERFVDRSRPVPGLHALTRNFRSVRGLVELANEVLSLKRDRTGRSDGDDLEESVVAGATPILVAGEEAELLEAIRGFGPRCAVIVGAAETRERLQAALETTRVFTVAEAKGLEFDVAILWGVVAADPEPWRRLLDLALSLREDPACRRALHHLYVAVTRARRHLAIYEPQDGPPLWRMERFASKLDREAPGLLSRLFVRSASPEQWRQEGEYFLERARHRQAAECYRRAGDERREAFSLALHHENAGEPGLAAARWLTLGEAARAARCLEQAEAFAAAAREWARAGDEPAARRCLARGAEVERRWSEAASVWETLEAWEEAARCWASAGLRPRQARCLALSAEKAGHFPDAARRWEEIEDWDRAAGAWRAAGREPEARAAEARRHEAHGRWDEAARAWEGAGDDRRALRCRAEAAQAAARWDTAASAWEELGEFGAAIRAWQRSGDPREGRRCMARRDVSEGRYLRAAEAFEELGDFAEAARVWARADEAGQQPSVPQLLPLPDAATVPWCERGKPARLARRMTRRGPGRSSRRRLDRPARPGVHGSRVRGLVCAARAAEDAGRFNEAAGAWKALGDDDQVLRCRVTERERAGDPRAAAQLLEAKQKYEAAAARWLRAGDRQGAARCEALLHEQSGRLVEATAAWTSLGEPVRAARCRAILHFRRGEYAQAAEGYEAAGDAGMAVTARILDAKLRSDYDGAKRLLKEAGMEHLFRHLLGNREKWLAEARLLARDHAGSQAAARRREAKTDQGSLFAPAVGAPRAIPEAAGLTPDPAWVAQGPLPKRDGISEAIRAALRQHPGLTCEGIAAVTGASTDRLKPVLATLAARGDIRRTGRTRGTRYHPA